MTEQKQVKVNSVCGKLLRGSNAIANLFRRLQSRLWTRVPLILILWYSQLFWSENLFSSYCSSATTCLRLHRLRFAPH